MLPKRKPTDPVKDLLRPISIWVTELLLPSGQWIVRQLDPTPALAIFVEMRESVIAMAEGVARPRYTLFSAKEPETVQLFAEIISRTFPHPTLPWTKSDIVIFESVIDEVMKKRGLPSEEEPGESRGELDPEIPAPSAPSGKSAAGKSAKKPAKAGGSAKSKNAPGQSAPEPKAKAKGMTNTAAAKEPKRSAAWLKKEAKHQKTLAGAITRIDDQLSFATGLRREYLLEVRKAFVGRPHDDPTWQFILCTTDSVDDTLSVEEGLHFLRGINEKKPLTIISGAALE